MASSHAVDSSDGANRIPLYEIRTECKASEKAKSMKNPRTPGHIVLYRWKIKPGLEDQFAASWSQVTQSLLERGSLGSRLHKGNDDTWYAYAQWPSNAAREKAFADTSDSPDQAKMREAVLESFPPVHLEPIADFLLPAGTAPKAFDGE